MFGGAAAVRIFHLTLFCVGGYLLTSNRRWIGAYIAAAVPTAAAGIACLAHPGVTVLVLSRDVLNQFLQSLLFYAVIRFALFRRDAGETERVIAGISGYLILGLLWSSLYAIHEHLIPGGFLGPEGSDVAVADGAFIYFSFVTLTTLGYGDVVPLAPLAKSLAILEAAAGTIYLGVFVASLVPGLRLGRLGGAPDQPTD